MEEGNKGLFHTGKLFSFVYLPVSGLNKSNYFLMFWFGQCSLSSGLSVSLRGPAQQCPGIILICAQSWYLRGFGEATTFFLIHLDAFFWEFYHSWIQLSLSHLCKVWYKLVLATVSQLHTMYTTVISAHFQDNYSSVRLNDRPIVTLAIHLWSTND